jgi:hypothetical protein
VLHWIDVRPALVLELRFDKLLCSVGLLKREWSSCMQRLVTDVRSGIDGSTVPGVVMCPLTEVESGYYDQGRPECTLRASAVVALIKCVCLIDFQQHMCVR